MANGISRSSSRRSGGRRKRMRIDVWCERERERAAVVVVVVLVVCLQRETPLGSIAVVC